MTSSHESRRTQRSRSLRRAALAFVVGGISILAPGCSKENSTTVVARPDCSSESAVPKVEQVRQVIRSGLDTSVIDLVCSDGGKFNSVDIVRSGEQGELTEPKPGDVVATTNNVTNVLNFNSEPIVSSKLNEDESRAEIVINQSNRTITEVQK